MGSHDAIAHDRNRRYSWNVFSVNDSRSALPSATAMPLGSGRNFQRE